MNQYLRHIGDWKAATANLTRTQRDIYSSLIDTYYDKERPLDSDFEMLSEDHGCRTAEELAALRYILKRYFKLDGDGRYRNERADEEIVAFHHRVESAQRAGKASGSARAQRKMNGTRTDVQRESNATSTERELPDDPITHPSSPDGEVGGERAAKTPPAPAPTAEPAKASKAGDAPPPPEPPEKAPTRPSRKAPKGFEVTREMLDWAKENCPLVSNGDVSIETAKFKDHTFSRSISDWVGAWRNWLRKEQQFRESKLPQQQQQPRLNGHAADRKARVDNFRAAVMGNSNAASRPSAIDVESRVVRDGEEQPPES